MAVKRYRYLFGPVPSRRFGRSLGVDLTPYKTCNQDCVFCQLGKTTNLTLSRGEYVPIREVKAELEDWLRADGEADYITLSGSGEPTLHSRFGEVLDFIRSSCRIPAVLLTNGAMLDLKEVQEAACCANVVKASLSAWDQTSYQWVNRPHPGLDFRRVVEGQKAFRDRFRGDLWIEVFLIPGVNSMPADVRAIAALTEQIRPNRIHLNTAVRPAAEDFVSPLSRERVQSLAHLFHPAAEVIADFTAKKRIDMRAAEEEVFAMLRRRPCTASEIAATFGMHLNEVSKYLGDLVRRERVQVRRSDRSIYYSARGE
ncbi:MAG: radical SAM protein [Deltaproteobacteria bacterium]|nr:radical SAM protein [Deltaproteobacteria bacterium]